LTDATPPAITQAVIAAVQELRRSCGMGIYPIAVHEGDALTWATLHDGAIVNWQTESPIDLNTAERLTNGRLHIIE
jgi:hypothetical protein